MLLLPGVLLLTGALYLAQPDFALSLNQVCDMLHFGNARGLAMTAFEAQAMGPVVMTAIGFLAWLVPTLHPEYLLEAGHQLYGPVQGAALPWLGFTAASLLLYLTGTGLRESFQYFSRADRPPWLPALVCIPAALLLWLGIAPLFAGVFLHSKQWGVVLTLAVPLLSLI